MSCIAAHVPSIATTRRAAVAGANARGAVACARPSARVAAAADSSSSASTSTSASTSAPVASPSASARVAGVAVAAAAALAMTLSPTRAAMAAAEDAAGAFAADGETAAVVVSESSPPESASASASSSSSAEEDEPEIVEISYEDVAVGAAPDIAAAKAKIQDREEKGLTELEQKAIDNNLKIKQYNNAPVDFPTFVREGYDVRVITPPGFVTQEDGLVYKDFQLGTGELPKDGQEVTFDYIAYNENGGTIDSTYRKNAPASTRLGINGMIPGFEEGLKGMREGGKRRVVVPPELGPPVGPATFFSSKQWEVFDIELIKIKNCERVQTGFMVSSVVCK